MKWRGPKQVQLDAFLMVMAAGISVAMWYAMRAVEAWLR